MINVPIAIQHTQNSGTAATGSAKTLGDSFSNFLGDALNKVNQSEETANKMAVDMANGKGQDLHTVMLAMEKSNILLQTTVEVRNKVIDAYQEIMRMQV